MGYIPPIPPIYGTFNCSGRTYIEVTTLGDDGPVYVRGHDTARILSDYAERLQWARHAAYMDTAYAETMRGARIGCILLAALVLDVVAMIAQAAGLL